MIELAYISAAEVTVHVMTKNPLQGYHRSLIQSYLELIGKQKGVECQKQKLIEKSLGEVPLPTKMPSLIASLPKQAIKK